MGWTCWLVSFFFFNDTATTEIYTLSLHDALPISQLSSCCHLISSNTNWRGSPEGRRLSIRLPSSDRKSTRLNSSHANISYAVFCLKKKKQQHLPSSIIAYYHTKIHSPHQ